MKKIHKIIAAVVIVIIIISCGFLLFGSENHTSGEGLSYNTTALSKNLTFNMNNWNYDESNDIYYQIGVVYCLKPASAEYESFGIYVPGKYLNGVKNSNGTYNCTINENNNVGNYSADSAPIVMHVNTPGYSSSKAPTSYNAAEVKDYTDAGFIYYNAGCRGRDAENVTGNAPWGVTDLKAAVSYLRFNDEIMPGDTNRIFTFGHSGGGAQSALMGATGDSELYNPYLEAIGAAMVDGNGNHISNSICGAMCWCPITSLDYADDAYEWNMGQFSDTGVRSNNTWTGQLSKNLAEEYAVYINELGLKDASANTLTLDESDSGVYTSGSYYDYMMGVCEDSLNNFLNDTTFPYTPSSNDAMPSGDMPAAEMPTAHAQDDVVSQQSSYQTASEYIDALNSDGEWIIYDASTNTAKITSMEAFITHCKNPSKSLGAFDDLDLSQAENNVFGTSNHSALHFDKTLAGLLKNNSDSYSKYSDYNSSYESAYSDDLSITDEMNNTVETRVNMYNPMYYLCDYYDGAGSSKVAEYWRINSGIEQSDTALSVETNLALALNQTSDVEFNVVWGQGHTQAERTGDSTSNFINWVNACFT